MLPVYLWSSGGVQISHAVFIVGSMVVLSGADLRLSTPEVILALLAGFVFVRESVAVILGGNVAVMLFPLYLVFNLVMFVSLNRWLQHRNALDSLVRGMIVATGIAFFGVLVLGYGADLYSYERAIGTFNNPNQLGYFSVCLYSLAALLFLTRRIHFLVFGGLAAASLVLAILSLSKAAMVSVLAPFVLIGFAVAKRAGLRFLGPMVSVLLVFCAFYVVSSGVIDDMIFVQRLSNLGGDPDDSLRARGYTVIFEANTIELLLGLGAERTSDIYSDGLSTDKFHEIHSTIFSFVITYGFVGGALFLALMFLWVREIFHRLGAVGVICIAGPPLAYGLTHNGSRFTLFWILVALSFVIWKDLERRSESRAYQASGRRIGPELLE